jgi:type II secretory pathway component PulJ
MSPLRFLLTHQFKHHRQARQTGGFTLIELLVAMVLAFLVITPLMGLAINIMETDRKEQAKANSEQEIKTALDYIAQDLQQAIYIYDADGLSTNQSNTGRSGIRNQIPPIAQEVGDCKRNNCPPVLVFWKRELQKNLVPGSNSVTDCGRITDQASKCNDAYTYSLVGYYLISDPATTRNNTWSTAARIARFEIKDGVRDPKRPTINRLPNWITYNGRRREADKGFEAFNLRGVGNLKQKMNRWKKGAAPYDSTSINVLVDYVDRETPSSQTIPAKLECDTTNIPGVTPLTKREQRVPTATTANTANSFYACVNSNENYARIYLRGNALARLEKKNPSPSYTENNSAYFPTTTIQVKGNGFLFTRQ